MKNIAEIVRNRLLYLPIEQVEKYVAIDSRMDFNDLSYGKYNLIYITGFFTESTDTNEIHEILNEFNNEINQLRSDYLNGRDKQSDDFIENALIVYNNLFDKCVEKDKPGLLSIQFLSQKTSVERVKLNNVSFVSV